MIVKKIDVFVYIAGQLGQRNLVRDEDSNAINAPLVEEHSNLHTRGVEEHEGRPLPWVRVGAEGEPKERFVGQKETFEKVANEHNVPLEELKRATPENLYWEIMRRVSK